MAELLRVEGVSKFFPGVKALENVDFSVNSGEVVALLGANGAGKSTLIKTISGLYTRETGNIYVDGKLVNFQSPAEGKKAGISNIYQELTIIPNLTVAENIFLSQIGRTPVLDYKKINQQAKSVLQGLGLENVQPSQKAGNLSIASQQMVEIARSIAEDAKILFMDEPTSALTTDEKEALFTVVRRLKAKGIGLIFVSHRIKEIFEICDRATILKDGQLVGHFDIRELTEDIIVEKMMGGILENFFPKVDVDIGDTILQVSHLSGGSVVKDVSFELRSGEVLGLTGLLGAGRTETIRCIFGLDPIDSGDIMYFGKRVCYTSPRQAILAGITLVPEDRKKEGLVLQMDILNNISLGRKKTPFIRNYRHEVETAKDCRERLQIKCSSLKQLTGKLSGGNQQKVIIGKCLLQQPKVLILDEPTKGIDVVAKAAVHALIGEMVQRGVSVILISSEYEEVIGMCDRIAVLYEGRSVGIVERKDFSEELLLNMSHGMGQD